MGAIEQRHTGELAERTPQQQAISAIRSESFQEQVKMALPGNVSVSRFVRATVTALMQNPAVVEGTDPDSFFQSVIRCAQDGLMPDGREAALVVFKGKVQYLAMVGGMRKIAAEYGWAINAQVVYDNDDFDYQLGLSPTLHHRPPRLGMDRGDPIGAYAVGTHSDGRKVVEVLAADQIEKVRQVSRAKDRGPWVEWTMRMWEKTAARALFARLPLGDRELVARVLDASELTPAQASDALYGPPSRALEASAPSLGVARPEGAEDVPAVMPDTGGAAGEDEPTPEGEPSEPTPPPTPNPDPDPDPAVEGEPSSLFMSPVPAGEVEQLARQAVEAGATPVPFGQHFEAGLTIAQVSALGQKGETWFTHLLTTASFGSTQKLTLAEQAAFREKVVAYVKVFHPDVWASFQGGQS